MRKIICLASMVILLSVFSSVYAMGDKQSDEEIDELKKEVQLLKLENAELKEAVLKLQQLMLPIKMKAQRKARQKAYNERYQTRRKEDNKHYTKNELSDASSLYQVANREWKSEKAIANLKMVLKKYPKCNRAGCAALYLGQMLTGSEKEKYYKMAIEQHSDSFYGDGVQVGAYARLLLAEYYKDNNQDAKAAVLLEEIEKLYPDAIDHKGNFLADQM